MRTSRILGRVLTWPLRAAAIVLVATLIPVPRPGVPDAAPEESRPVSLWVPFSQGTAVLTESSASELGQINRRVREGSPILVIGHARERPDMNDNLDLADRRARAVARHLVDLGIVSERIVVAGAESPATERDGYPCEVRFLARSSEP